MIISEITIPKEKFVVAVSGGADSLCLTLLAFEASLKSEVEMVAVFVDHQLRRESATEILPFVEIFNNLGINNKVLKWQHGDILGNIEKKAREARYSLLTAFCEDIGAKTILVAHHSLDVWETFFMRLSRGSGLKGLCSIRNVSEYNKIKIERPLLKYSKNDLLQTLERKYNVQNFINDPMNSESKYERVRWRNLYGEFDRKYELGTFSIIQSIERLQRADDCLDKIANDSKKIVFDGVSINLELFRSYHLELQTRILLKIIESVTGKKGRIVSYSLLEETAKKIQLHNFSAVTIANCLLRKTKDKKIKVSIEERCKSK